MVPCIAGGDGAAGGAGDPVSATAKAARSALFQPRHQPNRQLLAARGLSMVNVHCPEPDVLDRPKPFLDTLDKWRLWSKRRWEAVGGGRWEAVEQTKVGRSVAAGVAYGMVWRQCGIAVHVCEESTTGA